MIKDIKKIRWYVLSDIAPLPYLKESFRDILLATFFINILALALPIALMQVYDRIIVYNAKGTMIWIFTALFVAIVLESLFKIIRSYLVHWMSARFIHFSSTSVLKKILSSNIEELEKLTPSDILERFNGLNSIRNFYSGTIFQSLLDIPFLLIFFLAFFYLSPYLLSVTLSIILIYAAIIIYLRSKYIIAKKDSIDNSNTKFDKIIEFLNRLHYIKATNLEEQILRKFEHTQKGEKETLRTFDFYDQWPQNLGIIFSQILLFSLIWFGASLVIDGFLTIGALTACTMLSGRIMGPIQNLSQFLFKISEVNMAIEKIEGIANLQEDAHLSKPPFPKNILGNITLNNISLSQRDQNIPILEGSHFTIKHKVFIGVRAIPGKGTTSLIQLIRGAKAPQNGKILIDEYDLSQFNLSHLKGTVEYVSDKGILFKGTVLENITLFQEGLDVMAMDAATLLGIDKFISELPKGYETKLDSHSNNLLPKGLIQRLVLARSLVERPRILLLDRVDHYMDTESKSYYIDLLKHLKGHMTLVVSSLDKEVLSLAHKIYEIKDYQLVESPHD